MEATNVRSTLEYVAATSRLSKQTSQRVEISLELLDDVIEKLEAQEARIAALVAGIVRATETSDGRMYDDVMSDLLALCGYTVVRGAECQTTS